MNFHSLTTCSLVLILFLIENYDDLVHDDLTIFCVTPPCRPSLPTTKVKTCLVFGGDMVLGVVVRSTDCPLMPFYCRLWCPWMLSTSIREDLINFGVLLCEPDPPLRVGGAIFVVWWSRESARARASARGRMTQTRPPSCVSINHKTSQHLIVLLVRWAAATSGNTVLCS